MKETPSAETVSELNNLIQIISSTSSFIENIWEGTSGSQKYFEMLRASIARAEQVTAELATQAGRVRQTVRVHEKIEVRPTPASPSGNGAKPRHILLVDDETMTLSLLATFLADEGYKATCARSGFECLDLVQRKPTAYDLILLDLAMPGMDGAETFRRLRGIAPQANVILITGFVRQECLDGLLREGLCGFLGKPFTHPEILFLIETVLANRNKNGIPAAV